jgi:hypothetical protein
MYAPSAYFLAGWLCSSTTLLFYPIVTGSISFWFLEFNDSSWTNFLNWLTVLFILAISGSSFGFMFGCIIDNE